MSANQNKVSSGSGGFSRFKELMEFSDSNGGDISSFFSFYRTMAQRAAELWLRRTIIFSCRIHSLRIR